jgi:hypothetical protein
LGAWIKSVCGATYSPAPLLIAERAGASSKHHIAGKETRVQCVLTIAEPVEGILEPIFLDPEAARIQIANRHRRVHMPQ